MEMRIYVDFNTMTIAPEEKVYLNMQMQPALEKDLRPGLV